MRQALIAVAMTVVAGCGGDDSSVEPDGGGGGGDCEMGAVASSGRYLPYELGDLWRYRVTKVSTGEVTTKRQELTETMTPEGETEPVIVQITTKGNGTTETWNRLDGDVIRRIRQIDRDETGVVERQNVYEPSRLRLDETPARLVAGTTWMEEFDNIELDAAGVETGRVAVTEIWNVIAVDAACESPLGSFECLHVQRMASDADGGSVMKDYWFAPGLGKIREEGDAIEELLGCVLE